MERLSLGSRIPTLTARRSTAPVIYSHVGIPSSNRSINRGEEERGSFARSQQRICFTFVEDSAGVPVGVFLLFGDRESRMEDR
jgi:hypothetical protein